MLPEKTREYLLHGLADMPVTMEWMMKHAAPSDYDRRPDPDRFTLREVIAHLADWEAIWLQRMKLMRTENHPTFEVYDETERAIENDYAHSDIQMEEMMFRKHRTALVEFLSSLSLDEWERTALHPEWGVQTIESMAVHILGHDGYHARQIADWLSAAEDSREE